MVVVLLYLAAVVVLVPLETVVCMVAYRIQRGDKGLDISFGQLTVLSAIAAILLILINLPLAIAMPFVPRDYSLVVGGGAVLVLGMLRAQVLNWVYGLENWLVGLSILVLRIIPYTMLAIL